MDADSIQESCVLPNSVTAPALARGFVSSTLSSWAVGDAFADVPLLVSELVTNAVRHAEGDVALSLRLEPDRVRVAVTDASDALPVMSDLDDLDTARDGGWGLHIVERLASRWGLETQPDGKTVWCEVIEPNAAEARRQDR
jgi:anti-sigma regulatory factor (Ser/Thr protein kinase)